MNTYEELEKGYSTQRLSIFNMKFHSYVNNRTKVENYRVQYIIEIGDDKVAKTNDIYEVVPKG